MLIARTTAGTLENKNVVFLGDTTTLTNRLGTNSSTFSSYATQTPTSAGVVADLSHLIGYEA
jgi:hypothetical protein